MHILPFVSIFLIILATLSYSFLDKSKTLIYEKQTALSYMKIERQLLRRMHREAFKKAPKKKTAASKPAATPISDPELSPRTDSLSKMNLLPLFTEEVPTEFHSILEHLLQMLYQNTPLLEPATFNTILAQLTKNLIKIGKEKIALSKQLKEASTPLRLCDLYPHNPVEHALFYKMLKGTHAYNLLSEGYPPLEDFFCLNGETARTIFHFPSLSPLMLSALFGQEAATAILQEEKELRINTPDRSLKTLSKEELVALLHKKFPSQISYDRLIDYLGFSSNGQKKESLIGYDKITHLQIKHPLL